MRYLLSFLLIGFIVCCSAEKSPVESAKEHSEEVYHALLECIENTNTSVEMKNCRNKVMDEFELELDKIYETMTVKEADTYQKTIKSTFQDYRMKLDSIHKVKFGAPFYQ